MSCQYSILIQWSDEDHKYVVSLPEFGPYAHTHGDTYTEALKNALFDFSERCKALPIVKTKKYKS